MLTKVEVYDIRNNKLDLPLVGGRPFPIRDISGLDPIDGSVTSSDNAGHFGVQYQGIQGGARNIVLTLGLEPDFASDTVASLRLSLYRFFSIGSLVRMRFISTHLPTVEILGYVETCTAPMFVQTPFAQVSIVCTDPSFVGVTPVVVNGNSSDAVATPISYLGSDPSGFVLTIAADRALSGFTIQNSAPEAESLAFTFNIASGKFARASTVYGDKYAIISDTAVGAGSSIMRGLVAGSVWPELKPGNNDLLVNISGAAVPWTLTYTERYGGL